MSKWWLMGMGSDSGNMSGAYSLNALDAHERESFERHLARSETLRAESTEFSDTAALLADAVGEINPPDYLKTRIMAQIENTPQLAADEIADQPVLSPTREQKVRARAPRRNIFVGVATAFAFVLVAGGGYTAYQHTQTRPPVTQQASPVDQIRTAADVQTTEVRTARGKMQVIWSGDVAQAAIRNKDTIKLPVNSTYQLWVTDTSGKTISAGFIASNRGAWTVFDSKIAHGDKLRMTVEPKGGSKQPTSDALFSLDV